MEDPRSPDPAGSSATTLTDAELNCLKVEIRYPGVKVAQDVTFEDVWTLFRDSGFVYPEKAARLEPVMPQVQETVKALLQANGRLLTTVAVRGEKGLGAHISILRVFEQTILVQHLAALRHSAGGLEASARVSLALAYYGQLRRDFEWVKIFYRPNNAWPARVFGGFARQMQATPTSDLRVFHYLSAPSLAFAEAAIGPLEVRPADDRDWERVARWFTDRKRTVEAKANDLEPSRRGLEPLSQLFRSAGLERRRESLVAERGGRVRGFALLEISSLGLNFSELTNAFTVHLFEPDEDAHRALASAARRRYAEVGRPHCVALAEDEALRLFEAEGFVRVKDYACWTFHREHLVALEEYFATLFGAQGAKPA